MSTDDDAKNNAVKLDEMLAQSNSAIMVDLLGTVIFARAGAARTSNILSQNALFWEAQALVLRRAQRDLERLLNNEIKPEDVF